MPMEMLGHVQIFYEREGTGTPVVLVHGSWGDHHNWDAIVPELSRTHEIVRYDRRGHSGSGPASIPGTAEQDVDDLFALLGRLGIRQPVVIGNSFGATITLKAVARDPYRFAAIVVHEPPLVGLIADDPVHRGAVAHVRRLQESVVALLDAGRIEDGTRMFIETVAFGPGAWDTLPQPMRDTFMRNAATWPDELRDPEWSMVNRDALGRFEQPVLVTDSTESPPFFRAIVERIAPVFPRGRHVTYEGSGHVPHATHPHLYLPVVSSFLREVAPSLHHP